MDLTKPDIERCLKPEEGRGGNLKKPEIAARASSAAKQPEGEINEGRIGDAEANVVQA